MEQIKISLSLLTQDVNNGMTMDELSAKYGISVNSMKKIMSQAKLRIKKRAKVVLIDDVNNQ